MTKSTVVFWVTFILTTAGSVQACPDTEFYVHLRKLRALTPAVTAESPDRAALARFFEALPPDFVCFNRLFGYSDGPAPLYSEPQLYFLFPKIAVAVPERHYVQKLVGLSVDARWEADQTGALQNAARSMLDARTELFVTFLYELSPESERSVWAFLFGAPHPSNEPLTTNA